jgi:hypothetical protein
MANGAETSFRPYLHIVVVGGLGLWCIIDSNAVLKRPPLPTATESHTMSESTGVMHVILVQVSRYIPSKEVEVSFVERHGSHDMQRST